MTAEALAVRCTASMLAGNLRPILSCANEAQKKLSVDNRHGRDACEAARVASEISKARKKQGITVRDDERPTKKRTSAEPGGSRWRVKCDVPSIATDTILARPRFTTALAGDQSFLDVGVRCEHCFAG